MKLDPGFISHWKTERLIATLGPQGVVALLRMWGNAQIRREFSGLSLTPRRLAMETKWFGDENQLFDCFTDPDAPWLDKEDDGTFTIHGFEEHQHQVVKLWENGRKGGRPRKVSPTPSSKEKEDTSSSSYPICEPNGNQMVSGRSLCTIKQAISQAPTARMTEEEAEFWWNTRESTGWMKSSAGGGAPRKITSWQSDMATSLPWVQEAMAKQKKATGNGGSLSSKQVTI